MQRPESIFPIAFIIGPTKEWALIPTLRYIPTADGLDFVLDFMGIHIGFCYLNERARNKLRD